MSFDTLGLSPAIVAAIARAGFQDPTPVQSEAIPAALAGHDLMVSSQTGSGKTAAFMLPALHRLGDSGPLDPARMRRGVQVLVLTPTRELALQVTEATRNYAKGLQGLQIAAVVGGMPYGVQIKALSRRVDVLVATPGRLLDHLQSGRVDLSQVQTLVLDEADRMLDMGFIDDIEAIVAQTPAERQTLLFSATLDGTVARLAARMMREPKRIEMANQREKHANIEQNLLYADDFAHKSKLLDHLLRDVDLEQAIIFTSTKRAADDLAERLNEQGFAAAALHGDMNQRQRNRTLTQVQRGQVQMLVATDVAARGIDVQGITHVVNFDLPMQAEDYVHRIGRTGRAGRSGRAFTLAVHGERHKVRRIEQYTGQPIPPQVVAGLEPQRTPRPSTGGKPGGPRKSGDWGNRRPAQGGWKPGGRPTEGRGNSWGARGAEGRPAEARGSNWGNRPAEGRPTESRGNWGNRDENRGSNWGNRDEGRNSTGWGGRPAESRGAEGRSNTWAPRSTEGRPAESRGSWGDRGGNRPAGGRSDWSDRKPRSAGGPPAPRQRRAA